MSEPAAPRWTLPALLAGAGSLVGGGLWIAKALVTLSSGDDPAAIIEAAAAAQGLAVLGLAYLPGVSRSRAGRLHAIAAAIMGTATLAFYLRDPDDWTFHLLLFVTHLTVIGALFWIGRKIRAQQALAWASSLPRLMGIWTLPLLMLTSAFGGERDIPVELAFLLVGFAWELVGLAVLASRGGSDAARASGGTMSPPEPTKPG